MSRDISQVRSLLMGGVLLTAWISQVSADDSSLSIVDLEAYRIALNTRPDPSTRLVRFPDLWDHPETYLGQPVQVEGRVARLFRQPAVGEFPALTEVWMVSQANDPFCLVFPASDRKPAPEIGGTVRFVGTYLKRLKYQGGDVARLAPLIVGPEAPRSTASPESSRVDSSWSAIDWVMGLGAASVVALVLARRHLAQPSSLSQPVGPTPLFVDGKPFPDGSEDFGGEIDR